jgi:hypothetical protein
MPDPRPTTDDDEPRLFSGPTKKGRRVRPKGPKPDPLFEQERQAAGKKRGHLSMENEGPQPIPDPWWILAR